MPVRISSWNIGGCLSALVKKNKQALRKASDQLQVKNGGTPNSNPISTLQSVLFKGRKVNTNSEWFLINEI